MMALNNDGPIRHSLASHSIFHNLYLIWAQNKLLSSVARVTLQTEALHGG